MPPTPISDFQEEEDARLCKVRAGGVYADANMYSTLRSVRGRRVDLSWYRRNEDRYEFGIVL